MSVTYGEPDEKLWDYYLTSCRLDNTKPSYKDFMVWAQDHDIEISNE